MWELCSRLALGRQLQRRKTQHWPTLLAATKVQRLSRLEAMATHAMHAGEPWEFCSRSALVKQLQRLKAQHELTLRVGIEIEFHLLRAVPGSHPVAYEAIDNSGPGDGAAVDAIADGGCLWCWAAVHMCGWLKTHDACWHLLQLHIHLWAAQAPHG